MSARFDVIDLGRLPKPEVIEEISFEAGKQALLSAMETRFPGFSASVLESDPAVKLLEVAAYEAMLVRQRVNDAARSVMLAFARGSDLDHIAARYAVERLVLDPGDPGASPPIPPTHEADDAFLRRVQLSPEAMSVAGPRGGYIFNGLSAGETPVSVSVASTEPGMVMISYAFDADGAAAAVKDIEAVQTNPGEVTVAVMGWDGDGTPAQSVLDAVSAHLTSEHVRPLTDTVIVQPVGVVTYGIEAILEVSDGPEAPLIEAAARAAVEAYAAAQHRIGRRVTESGLKAALTVEGVEKVRLVQPAADVEPSQLQTAYVTAIEVTSEVAS